MRFNNSKPDKFKNWLMNAGCEILPSTNEYERIRWKGESTGVIYTSGNTSGKYAKQAINEFNMGKAYTGGPISTGRKKNYVRQKRSLIKRDGSDCFFCGKPLGEDITVEHLIPLTSGGANRLSNLVLAHDACNTLAGTMSIVDKVKLAIELRHEKAKI